MVKVEIHCPSCSKRDKIEVTEEEVRNNKRGLYAVNISKGIICEHSFVAYLDKNLTVRDAFIADFQIALPEPIKEQQIEVKSVAPIEKVDVDLLKINFTASMFAYMLRAMLFKKKIVIISEKEFLLDHLKAFFDFVNLEAFKIDILIIPKENYNSVDHPNHVAIEGTKVIHDDENILAPKKMKVERTLIQAFLQEIDPTSSLRVLRTEVKRIYDLSNTIAEYVSGLSKKEKIYSKTLIDEIKKQNDVKIQIPYLDYLIDVVEHYFEIYIPISSNISNFLGTL